MNMWIMAVMAATLLASGPAAARGLNLDSGDARVRTVELYTSEGCSSCPRADAWLNRLDKDTRLWREFVPMAFHVDYWDYIGWPDRFASPRHSARQKNYARKGHLRSVYTPGFVVGGQEWRGWFSRPVLPESPGKSVGPLKVSVDQRQASAVYEPSLSLPGKLDLHVAVLGFDLETEIKGGENAGKTLAHQFVVLGHSSGAMQQTGKQYKGGLSLPKLDIRANRLAIAAWVSLPGDPRPIQATGGWYMPNAN